MRRIIALAALISVVILGGAIRPDRGPGVSSSGYSVGFNTSSTSEWDTVSIILFTGPMVTVAAATDTFAYPSGAGAADQARIHTLNDIVLGRDRKSWRADNADTARLYRMGTGFEIPTFAYTEIDSGRYNAGPQAKDASGVATALVSDGRDLFDGVAALNMQAAWNTPADTARNRGFSHFELVYVPWDSIIPPNSTIVSASINVSLNSNYYFASNDTIVTTLMTNAGDDKWYKVFGWDANHPSIAKATWNAQRSSSWGSVTTAHPWVPSLASRAKMWDWGQISDWSGSTVEGAGFIPQYTNYAISATNCVQAAVNGATSNGLVISLHCAGTTYEKFGHYNWDRYNNATVAGRTPYIHIKYITRKYRKPFGNAEWAFLFSTDDAKYQANTSFDSVMALHGGKYTIFASERLLGSPTYCTQAQLMALYGSGNEIGNHSSRHVPAAGTGGGLLHYHKTALNGGGNLAVGAATTGWDSLMLDCSPAWMYTMAEAQGYGDLSGDRRFAKSHALPNGGWSPEIFEALYRNGYTAIRGTGAAKTYDRKMYFEGGPSAPAAPIGKARADTIWLDGPPSQSARYARNMSLMAVTISASVVGGQDIFGDKADPAGDAAELEEVRNNVRRLAYQLIGQNRRALITFTHDEKTRPAAPAGYTDGVNPDELDAALDVVDSFAGGGRYMGYAEYKDWIKSGSTGIATPAFATAPDTFQVQATEKIWCIPDGVDNRWIRGVK